MIFLLDVWSFYFIFVNMINIIMFIEKILDLEVELYVYQEMMKY